MTSQLQEDYANYLLSFPWDAYHTQTFRNTRHDGTNAAIAWWHTMHNKLEWTRSFVAVEKHRLGGVHLHALVYNEFIDYTEPARAAREVRARIASTKKYCDKAFGFSSISEAKNQATVNLYCAKYVVKQDGDYFFLGLWE